MSEHSRLALLLIFVIVSILNIALAVLLAGRTVKLSNANDKIESLTNQLTEAKSEVITYSDLVQVRKDLLKSKRFYDLMKDYYEKTLRDLSDKGLIEFEAPKPDDYFYCKYDQVCAEMYARDKLNNLAETPYPFNIQTYPMQKD